MRDQVFLRALDETVGISDGGRLLYKLLHGNNIVVTPADTQQELEAPPGYLLDAGQLHAATRWLQIERHLAASEKYIKMFEWSTNNSTRHGLPRWFYTKCLLQWKSIARPPHSIWYMTRISVLNAAKKGVYFKDFAGPRFHENRGIFSIQTSSVISVSHGLNISWLF